MQKRAHVEGSATLLEGKAITGQQVAPTSHTDRCALDVHATKNKTPVKYR